MHKLVVVGINLKGGKNMKTFNTVNFKIDNLSLDVSLTSDGDAWLTQEQISILFDKARSTITEHINNIFKQGILDEGSSVGISDISPKKRAKLYNLDMIVAVGYRVGSKRGLLLRNFVNEYFASFRDVEIKNNQEVIIYNNGSISLSVNVSIEEETVWLTLDEIAQLFDRDRSVIGKHIRHLLKEEFEGKSVWAKFARTGTDGKKYMVDFYNLDMILAVGYRVQSARAIEFRKWVTSVLKEYIFKGYAVNDKRCLECQNSILDLKIEFLS